MVKQVFRLIYIATVLLMVGCTPELDEVCTTTGSQDSIFTYTMYFDSPRPSYDGTTRINNAGEWENGDIVFLYLLGPNEAYAQAVYNSSSKNWTVTSSVSVASAEGADCHIWCAEGKNPVQSSADGSKYYQYEYMTAAFSTTYPEGKYTCSNNGVIFVNATLSPRGWRIRFKGNPGAMVRIEESNDFYHNNRVYYDGKYDYLSALDNFELTVGNDGYTDYFTGTASPKCSQIRVTNVAEGITYNRHFDQETLTYYGGSGCYTIPTASNLHGWTREGEPIHEHVDLGLPSGLKWATCNVGASSPEEYGDYFAWGETEPKDYYDWSAYKWCNGGAYSMTKYCTQSYFGTVDHKATLDTEDDAAHANWGRAWRMPTREEQSELLDKCSWTWTTQLGTDGYKVVGPNGNSIFLPAAGYRLDGYLNDAGSYGYYWSSSLYAGDSNDAYCLDFNSRFCGWNYRGRNYGLSVRPVCQ